jgi:hypothetical protein
MDAAVALKSKLTAEQTHAPTNNPSFSFLLSHCTLRLTLRHKLLNLGGEDHAPFQSSAHVGGGRSLFEEKRSPPRGAGARSDTENGHA